MFFYEGLFSPSIPVCVGGGVWVWVCVHGVSMETHGVSMDGKVGLVLHVDEVSSSLPLERKFSPFFTRVSSSQSFSFLKVAVYSGWFLFYTKNLWGPRSTVISMSPFVCLKLFIIMFFLRGLSVTLVFTSLIRNVNKIPFFLDRTKYTAL